MGDRREKYLLHVILNLSLFSLSNRGVISHEDEYLVLTDD